MMVAMFAMVFAMASQSMAEPMPLTEARAVSTDATNEMSCCPEKGAIVKSCAQMCPALSPASVAALYVPKVQSLRFEPRTETRAGLNYEPLAPPPR